jgi:saccharopine dehydrogenase (NAD+, L-lysine-forming)
MRAETRATEQRAPIVPEDAARLVASGTELVVEESAHRAFPAADYAAAGCRIVPEASWPGAPEGHVVVGLKELPEEPGRLAHRHVYFGHAYKGQDGAGDLLRRFRSGGGALLDIEYLVDDAGRRLAAFGYWAGYVGAALAVLRFRDRLAAPLSPWTKQELDDELRASQATEVDPRVLVVGALGRCGRGARDALEVAGIAPTCWDLEETRVLDRPALLGHDVLVNTVLTARPLPPFLRPEDLDFADRRLSLVADVTCDVTSDCNMLPVYDRVTTWSEPVLRVRGGARPLDVVAIDNLPSLLPREASAAFSAELTPHLLTLGGADGVWPRCAAEFHAACARLGLDAADPASGPASDADPAHEHDHDDHNHDHDHDHDRQETADV